MWGKKAAAFRELTALAIASMTAAITACVSSSPSSGPSVDAGSFDFDVSQPGPPPADGAITDSATSDAAPADAALSDGAPSVPDGATGDAQAADAGQDAAPSCAINNGGCPTNSACAIDAGVVCTCNAGYSGATCASDCLTNNGGCDPNATCSNGDAGVLCACNPGYTGTGATCTSLCLTNNGGCDPNATCSNGATGVMCTCNPGYSGTGLSCASDDYTDWPPPPDSPLEAQYATSGDGTIVLDRATGLVWQRQLYAGACPTDDDAGDGCTYAHAQAYCTSLNATALGGLTGWRLPSLVELQSIVNYSDGQPAIDTSLFPGTPPSLFWSNTKCAQTPGNAWAMSFSTGYNAQASTAGILPVRCVTSSPPGAISASCGLVGQPCCYAQSCQPDGQCTAGTCARAVDYVQVPPTTDHPLEAQFVVSGDGSIVQDKGTGYYWQRSLPASPCPSDGAGVCNWADAASYCQSLNALAPGGISSGWRLPSLVELTSIVNYGTPAPEIDTAVFGDTPAQDFWTSTAYAPSSANAWNVSFANGFGTPLAKSSSVYVRCMSTSAPATTTACGTAGKACCYASACGSGLTCSGGTCITDVAFTVAPPETDFPKETAFQVSTDGTIVTDPITGLHWQRDVFDNPCPADGAGVCTWADAAAYCASLDKNQLGGITTGWRLPSLVELVAIQNYSTPNTTLDTAIFPPAANGAYWTSTPWAHGPTNAWAVNTTNGFGSALGTTFAAYVRCVSADAPSATPTGCGLSGEPCCYAAGCGAQLSCGSSSTCSLDLDWAQVITTDTPGEAAYAVSPGGSVVADHGTGLVWQRQLEAVACSGDAGTPGCTWGEAATYCAGMNARALGGYASGWRLPSIHELVSLVNYSTGITAPTIDTSLFPGTPQSPFWTSTGYRLSPANAFAVSFADGFATPTVTTSAQSVRCVNGAAVSPAPESCGALGQACCTTGACAAALTCSGSVCVHDAEYSRWPPPPEQAPAAQYTIAGSVITDTATGIKWAQTAGTATWAAAQTQCAALDATLGNLGWRLPTVVELTSIVSEGSTTTPMVQTAVFTQITATPYWTATPYAHGSGTAWSVSFASGFATAATTGTSYGVVCVSSN